jgi:hypothetical protein
MSVTDKRVGFPSLYKATYEDGWELKNLGYEIRNHKTNPQIKKDHILVIHLNGVLI